MAVGYEFLREVDHLPVFPVKRAAQVRPVTRVMIEADLIAVPAGVAPTTEDRFEHVLFALKHEGVNLQVLAHALRRIPAERLQQAVLDTPNGQYVRIAAHLWEAFNDAQLATRPDITAGYAEVFDSARYLVGQSRRDPRWRVDFNGLGPLVYCPTIERTDAIQRGIDAGILERTTAFVDGLDPMLRDRALTWAYLHETEDSYAIEKEAPTEDKAQLFVQLLQQAHDGRPLDEAYLCELQSSTVTNPMLHADQFRHEQNWLRRPGRGASAVTYVPPPPELVSPLMDEWMGLANSAPRHLDPIVAAAIISFGFVFLHPFMDGNGRLSRFLFHKALCDSGRLAQGLLLPVSVAMKRHEAEYLAALQSYSRPARDLVGVQWIGEGDYRFSFKSDDAMFRYWDATPCVEFGFKMAELALEVELRHETEFLARYDQILRSVNEQVDLMGNDLTTLIIICMDAGGTISNKKRKRYATRVPERYFDVIENAVREVLEDVDADGSSL